MKLLIQEKHRGDVHYVWCSESFDSRKFSPHSGRSGIPPSSNPVDIYKDLAEAVKRKDAHCDKINKQKLGMKSLAADWFAANEITQAAMEDIIYQVDNYGIEYWRPIIYVIPRSLIDTSRLQAVPAKDRAGFGDEFIISDLDRSEFDTIEFD